MPGARSSASSQAGSAAGGVALPFRGGYPILQVDGTLGLHHQSVAEQIVDFVNHQQAGPFARQLDAAAGDRILDFRPLP